MENKALTKSVNDYVHFLEKVLEKRRQWKEITLPLLLKTLNEIRDSHEIGWKIQQLDWLYNSNAVNITFDNFPKSLIERGYRSADFEFIKGSSLVFSQKYNGDIAVFILYSEVTEPVSDNNINETKTYSPFEFNENFIINKVTHFLEKIIIKEENFAKRKVGF